MRPVPTRLQLMRAELYSRGEATPELVSYRRALNVHHDVVTAYAGLLAVCLSRFYSDSCGHEIFDFDPDGVPSAVIEVLAYDQQRQECVADLVSWPLHHPAGFATALGPQAGAAMLGIVHMVLRGGSPLRVYCTPHQWLAAGCLGCVPLTNAGGRYWLDRAGGPFVVGDLEEGRWLRDLLGASASRHRILVPASEDMVAA